MKSIILLHGALGSQEQMMPLANLLSNTYKVHTFDFLGHGKKSGSSQNFNIELLSYGLDEYITEHQIDNPAVFGYSMGGYVALYHALLYPGYIKKIITLATKFEWTIENSEKEVIQLDVKAMKVKIPDFVNVLRLRHGEHWEKVVENTAIMMLELGRTRSLNAHNLPNIITDAMLCIGDKDKMVSLIETESTAKLLPNGNLKILKDTTHPFERLDYNLIADVIKEFALP